MHGYYLGSQFQNTSPHVQFQN